MGGGLFDHRRQIPSTCTRYRLPIEMHDGGCGGSLRGKINAAVEMMGCWAGENEPGMG